jgi:pimeloyl-ACP methyl ester carboxylesterase
MALMRDTDVLLENWFKHKNFAQMEIDSYNQFVDKHLQSIVNENKSIVPKIEEVRIELEDSVRRYDNREALRQLRTPTLLLVGSEDQVSPPAFTRSLAQSMSHRDSCLRRWSTAEVGRCPRSTVSCRSTARRSGHSDEDRSRC